MNSVLNWKKYVLDILLLLVSIYGFFWICVGAYYCYPNAEDLMEAGSSRNMGAFSRMVETLQIVDGRYTTNLLHGINPLAFGYYYGYKLMPVITFVLLFTGVYFLLKAVSKLNVNHWIHALSLVIFFLCAMDLSSSFFWMICSFVYIYPIIFILFFFNCFIRYSRSGSGFHFFFSLVFIFLAVGTSELSVPTVGGILFGLLLHHWKNTELRKAVMLLILVYLFSVVLLIASPGVLVRASHYEGNASLGLVSIIRLSFKYSFQTFAGFQFIPLFLYLVIFVRTYFKAPQFQKVSIPVLIGLGLIFAVWFVVLAAKGDQGFSSRITTFPVAIAAFVLVLIFSKLKFLFRPNRSGEFLILMTICIFTYASSSFSAVRKDFASGKLSVFKREMDLQYHTLNAPRKCDSTMISARSVVDVTEFLPESVTDSPIKYIQENRTDIGGNRSYEKYFKLDEVLLKNDTVRVLNKIHEIVGY